MDLVTQYMSVKDALGTVPEGVDPDAQFVRKGVVAKIETDEDERTVTATISTDTLDRDGEVILPKGIDLEAFLANPVVQWGHDYSEPPIGRALWMKTGRNKLVSKTQFASRPATHVGEWKPDTILHLYKTGFLKAFSIGFIPREWRDLDEKDIAKRPDWAGGKRIFTSVELLEYSAVPIPANPAALADAKAKGLEVPEEIELPEAESGKGVETFSDLAMLAAKGIVCTKCHADILPAANCPECGDEIRHGDGTTTIHRTITQLGDAKVTEETVVIDPATIDAGDAPILENHDPENVLHEDEIIICNECRAVMVKGSMECPACRDEIHPPQLSQKVERVTPEPEPQLHVSRHVQDMGPIKIERVPPTRVVLLDTNTEEIDEEEAARAEGRVAL